MGGDARRVFWGSVLLAVAAVAVCPFLGGSGMDYGKLWRREAPDWDIFVELRMTRTLLALITGAALSAAGALFQALLRDALATPSSLGVSSAAAMGAVSAIALWPGDEAGFPIVWAAALAGAGAVIALVIALGHLRRFTPFSLLLTGIAVNGICASVVLLLHSLAGITKSFQITHWLLGSVDAVGYPVLAVLAAALAPCFVWMLRRARVLNVISYGETWAAGRGVDYRRVTWQGFAVGALLVGSTTAVTGPIAFVGLLVPHLLRRVVGPDNRVLLPASLFGGGAFLVICDTVARSAFAPMEVPVGVVTALLGGPFFVWLVWAR
jgi:iron complex transport system permease protein